jgi:hypothetical protein
LNTDNITNVTKPTITGKADPNNTITLYDGDGTTILGNATANSSGIWSITTTTNLTNGNHNLTATARDTAGNSNTSTALTITIDTICNRPNLDLIAASNSGVSNTDNITNDNTPTITGTADANDTITLYDGGVTGTVLGTTTANSSGNWSITPTANLTNGNHNLTATASDIDGNSNTSTALTITINTVAPTVAISSVTTLKAGETATITFTFSENPQGFTWDGTSGDITVSGGSLSAISGTGRTRTATFTPTPDQNKISNASISEADNSYTDGAGNQGSGNTLTQALDTRQLTIVRAHYTDYNKSILVEYNGIVTVTGRPKLIVMDTNKNVIAEYQVPAGDSKYDTKTDNYVTGQTLVFTGSAAIELTNKILTIDLNGSTIKSKDNTTNSLGETIAKDTNAQLNPPTYRGRGIIGTAGHDLIEGANNTQPTVDTLIGNGGGDTFQIREKDALIGGTADTPTLETIKNLNIGVDNLTGRFTVNPEKGVISSKWQQMQILSSPLSTLTRATISNLLNQGTNFKAQGASTFTFGSGTTKRTFIALNDGTAGFQSSSDDIVEITGYSGDLRGLAIWKVL